MKDLLCVHVVVKTLNLEIFSSFGRLRQRTVLKCVPHVQHDCFSSFYQSDHCFLASSLPFPSSLLKLLITTTTTLGIDQENYGHTPTDLTYTNPNPSLKVLLKTVLLKSFVITTSRNHLRNGHIFLYRPLQQPITLTT